MQLGARVYGRTMPRSKSALAAMVVAALAFPAVAGAKTVHRSDSGKTITLAKGEKLVVKLKECAPCGYSWKTGVAPAKTILKRTGNTYQEPPQTTPPTAGASGTRIVTYVARKAGSTKLRLDYLGPTGEVGGHFRLTIRVKAS